MRNRAVKLGVTLPPAVLLGGRANALSAARSLGKRGIPVTVLDDHGEAALVARSKYCVHYIDSPSGGAPGVSWLEWLQLYGRGSIVLPCSDVALDFCARWYADLVAAGIRPIEADYEGTLLSLNKLRAYEHVRNADIRAPITVRLASRDDIEEVLTEVGVPCGIKPVTPHQFWEAVARQPAEFERWRTHPKGTVISDIASLRAIAGPLVDAGIEVLATEVVRGPDNGFCSYYTYLDGDGAPLLHFTKRKPRQYPIHFGEGTFHETRWQPDVADLGLRVCRALGVRGICNVEFKRELGSGALVFIECNGRLTASDALERRAGLDLAWIAYGRAVGILDPVPTSFTYGMRMWLPKNDWHAFVDYRREGELSAREWVSSLAHPQTFPVFDAADLGPSLAMVRQRGRRLGRLIRSGVTSRARGA